MFSQVDAGRTIMKFVVFDGVVVLGALMIREIIRTAIKTATEETVERVYQRILDEQEEVREESILNEVENPLVPKPLEKVSEMKEPVNVQKLQPRDLAKSSAELARHTDEKL